MHTFSTPGPIHLRVEHGVGTVQVYADQTDQTTVELTTMGSGDGQAVIDKATVEQRGDEIVVLLPKPSGSSFFGRAGGVKTTVHLPQGSRLKVRSASADVECLGTLGDVDIETASGDIRLEDVEAGRVRTGSGDIAVEAAHRVTTKSGSGDTSIGAVATDADMTSGSGDLFLQRVSGRLKAKTGSGDIVLQNAGEAVEVAVGSGDLLVKRVEFGRIHARSGSGDVSVGVADGTAAYLDVMTVSGDVSSSLDPAEQPSDGDRAVELVIRSGSGDVVLQRS